MRRVRRHSEDHDGVVRELTLDAGGRLAIVNATETHLDHLAVFVAREQAGVLLGAAREYVTARL